MNETMFTVRSRIKEFFLESKVTKDDIVLTLEDKDKIYGLTWKDGHLVLQAGREYDKLEKLWSPDPK